METAFMMGAWALFVGTAAALLWWRLAPADVGGGDHSAVGFDGPLPRWHAPTAPRPGEIEWVDAEERPTGLRRFARGVGLVLLVVAAGMVLATLLFEGGKYVIHQVISHFGSGLG